MSQQEQQPAYDPLDWLDMADERWRALRLGDRRFTGLPVAAIREDKT